MADTFISSREVVEEIWRHVAAKRELRASSEIRGFPALPQLNDDMERHLINARCVLDRGPGEPPLAPPFAKIKRIVKRRAAAFTMAVLQRYFDDEQEFLAHLVRYQNNVADAHDQLVREVSALHRGTLLECERLMSKLEALEETVQRIRMADAS